jgi:ABC-2 type transport system permease protein
MTSNVWAVVRREYLQRVRSKWFIASTVGGPLLMAALMLLPAYMANQGEEKARTLVIVDRTESLYEGLATRLEDAEYEVSPERWSPDVVAALTQRVTDGEIGGFIVLDQETLSSGEAVLFGTQRPSTIRRLALRGAIAESALEVQLEGQGVDVSALMRGGELRIEMLSEDAGMDEPRVVMAFVGAFLLYMVILLYAVAVMRATLEEKTSRIVEIVISSMKPWHLMLGKIVGVGAVGLTQMAVWIASAFVIASMGLPALIAANPEMENLQDVREALPGAGMLMLLLGFFLFGYFIFSGMYAAVGAMCNTDEEAQQAQWPVVMLVIVPAVLIMPVLESPNSALAVSLSLVPFFSPILMWARAAAGAAPWWQIAVSFVLMAFTVVAVAWVAGRIYKVGILMAGKRPTVPELWRWVKEA